MILQEHLLISFFIYRKQRKETRLSSKSFSLSLNQMDFDFDENNQTKNLYKSIYFIIFLMILIDLLLSVFSDTLKDLDFWMVELLIITYIFNKMFNAQSFSHQKLAIGINLFSSLLKIFTIYLSSKDDTTQILYMVYKWLIPIGIIIYLILITLESYFYVKIKYFMDKNFISVEFLLIVFGIIGTIFYLFICIIINFTKCSSYLSDNLCKIFSDPDDFDSDSYIDNFGIYFKNFKKGVISEIIIILLGIITFFLYYYFSLLVLKLLSPIHVIFFYAIYYFTKKIILPISTLIQSNSFFTENPMEYIYPKYFLDFSQDILCVIGFLIYLEIIELNFCKYNYNLRKNIIRRSTIDSKMSEKNSKFIFLEDGDIEENINNSNDFNNSYNNSNSFKLYNSKKTNK